MSGMIYVRPFSPVGSTVNLVLAATSANVKVTRPTIGTQTLRLTNSGTAPVFVAFGKDNTVVATEATGFPVLGNESVNVLLPNDISYVAAIATAAGSTLYITTGESS